MPWVHFYSLCSVYWTYWSLPSPTENTWVTLELISQLELYNQYNYCTLHISYSAILTTQCIVVCVPSTSTPVHITSGVAWVHSASPLELEDTLYWFIQILHSVLNHYKRHNSPSLLALKLSVSSMSECRLLFSVRRCSRCTLPPSWFWWVKRSEIHCTFNNRECEDWYSIVMTTSWWYKVILISGKIHFVV